MPQIFTANRSIRAKSPTPTPSPLRTSVIGHELGTNLALLDWFLSQRGFQAVSGYTKAIYSGFTTLEMARIVDRILTPTPLTFPACGNVASEPISKFALLQLCREKLGWEGVIEPYDEFVCDRSLNADRFNQATGYTPPSWEESMRSANSRSNHERSGRASSLSSRCTTGNASIRATLDSLAAQTLRPDRVIVLDDASTDGTLTTRRDVRATRIAN